VPRRGTRFRVVLAPLAKADIRDVLDWSVKNFGVRAARRYKDLLQQALKDIGDDPRRAGFQQRDELAPGILVYHLRLSRDRTKSSLGLVHNPRHFLIYRCREDRLMVDVARILHDARELQRHLPERYRSKPDETE
jgi:toxin ParE1/3/4